MNAAESKLTKLRIQRFRALVGIDVDFGDHNAGPIHGDLGYAAAIGPPCDSYTWRRQFD
ncbi:hypothetical protein [Mycobacterium dioxanotrophicus]|jgi:hypothetical protein|uniref:hypothetical protein n=1 Tax=Mycobacterium dioxanotrophicus TaxID=482462 RepID=UPI0012FBBBCD|nr:hypothetical protein [Mycobacterium dioxanotrophicus]